MNGVHMKPRFTVWSLKSAVAVAAVLVAAALALVRMPPTSRGVVWAEDGGIFLRDALQREGVLDIFAPYEGYLHVIPRFAAKSVVRFFRVDDYGLAMNLLSCVVVGIVALLVFHCSKAITTNVYARLGWASITIFVAPAPIETLGNFANIHSYLLWLSLWLLVKPAKSRAEGAMLFTVALLVSLTEIVAVLFVPMFLWRFKERGLWPARAGLALGLAMQFTTTILHPRSDNYTYPVDLLSVIVGWFVNTSSALLYGGSAQIGVNIQNYGFWPPLIAAWAFAAVWIFILVKGNAQQRILGIVLVLASVAVWGSTLILNFTPYFDYANFTQAQWFSQFFVSRYSTVPSMFLLSLLPLAALCGGLKSRQAAAAALTALVVLQGAYFFPSGSARSGGPDWKQGVEQARTQCVENPSLGSSSVPIAPEGWLKGGLPVSCIVLRPTP
ncbi:hypothetical protein ACFUCV_10475 [Specibacter sp. NPDC057265]|uniref:hypothetical protein n=1 Tax=Specibacter sp. NPDC057265 TaxID=3346075 RepID=UPI003639181C